jgi:hypothetical protein
VCSSIMEPRRHNRSGNHRRTRERQVEKQNKQSAPETHRVAEDNIRRNPASSRMSSLAMPPLSGDDDYVRRWLAETEQESKVDHGQPVLEQKHSGRSTTWLLRTLYAKLSLRRPSRKPSKSTIRSPDFPSHGIRY